MDVTFNFKITPEMANERAIFYKLNFFNPLNNEKFGDQMTVLIEINLQ